MGMGLPKGGGGGDLMQLPRGVWDWIHVTQGSVRSIAVELEKLRLLREYELGVKVGRDKKTGTYTVQREP